ncbi:succinate semialdehyde dehydrogenase [Bacillus sp. OV194]|nr:succinate semialdehyde dehydrogenase [Bacillus sp. OV194]
MEADIAALVKTEMFIDGEWLEAAKGERHPVRNPATGELIASVAFGGERDAERAVNAAERAFPHWAAETAEIRADYLRTTYNLIIEDADRLAKILTMEEGKPLAEAKREVLWGAEYVLWYAGEAKRIYGEILPSSEQNQRLLVQRHPVGIVAAITPWNFPFSMITRKLAPALAAGCTVVIKPSPETPLSAIALFEIFEKAGLPHGAANLVIGNAKEISGVFVNHDKVRKISFTGSAQIGKQFMEQAAKKLKKVSLELGGHAPFIVFDDADIDLAVDGLIRNKFQNNGQTCTCANRVFVQKTVLDRFTVVLTEKIKELKIGNGLEQGVEIGPLIHRAALSQVQIQVEDAVHKGAEIIAGGNPLRNGVYKKGNFFEPTILCDVTQEMKIFQEETFGPVIPLIPFETEDEAVEQANETVYGLAAYVYTKNLGRTIRVSDRLEFGMIGINGTKVGYVQAPFGGMKESGMGREGGKYGLDEFLEYKLLNFNY